VPKEREVAIQAGSAVLSGDFEAPEGSHALVVFAHGSGSSRKSSRNRLVAAALRSYGLGTLLFDLLTPEEDQAPERRFDVPILTLRLAAAVEQFAEGRSIGLFGASTGAAAALGVAAEMPDTIKAVVSRGGRPDLAWDALPRVLSPTLLIVGGWDTEVLELNRRALARLPATTEKCLEVVPEATHLFEEPGKLEKVAHLSADWFVERLS
jgi:pimeloyl-ACP methyl ester carboxylesterase